MKIRSGWLIGVVVVAGLGAIASVRALTDRRRSDNSPTQTQVASREDADAPEQNDVGGKTLPMMDVTTGSREPRTASGPSNPPPDRRSDVVGAKSADPSSGVMEEFRTTLGEIELAGDASREVLEDIFALQNRMNREELAASMKELKLALRNVHRQAILDQSERAKK